MANSMREQIMQAVLATLKPVADQHGALLRRQPADPVDENTPKVLAVFPDSNVPDDGRKNLAVQHTLFLRIVPQVYSSVENQAEILADQILVDVHRALFADKNRNFGGLVLSIEERECNWITESGELFVGQIPAVYAFTYRTRESDISLKG